MYTDGIRGAKNGGKLRSSRNSVSHVQNLSSTTSYRFQCSHERREWFTVLGPTSSADSTWLQRLGKVSEATLEKHAKAAAEHLLVQFNVIKAFPSRRTKLASFALAVDSRMLPEIAAEALHFLSRRDLDKASAVSRWFDAMIAKCCDEYPLRPVFEVALDNYENNLTLSVRTEKDHAGTDHSFGSMDEAAHFVGSILRHSYVQELKVAFSDSL